MGLARFGVVFAAVCGCVPVPDFVGITGDGGADDAGGDGGSDVVPPGMVAVHVVSRDGLATPVTGALVVAVDPNQDTRNVATDSLGNATLMIEPGGTIYVLTTITTPMPGHSLVGILDVNPGQTLEVGLPAFALAPDHIVALNGTTAAAQTYIAAGHCFSGQSSSPVFTINLTERCTTPYDLLYIAESNATGFVGWSYTKNLSVTTSTVSPGSYQPPIPLTASFPGFNGIELVASFSMIGMFGDELALRSTPVMGGPITRGISAQIAAPTQTFLVALTATLGTDAQKIVASGDIVSGAASLTINESLLAPFVMPAIMGGNHVVQWSQSGSGSAQLAVIDGAITTHTGTGQRLEFRYIKPYDGVTSFAIPDLPTVLDAYDLSSSDTGPVDVHIYKFPAAIDYHAVAPIADAHRLYNDFYLVPALRPTTTSGP